MDSEKIFFKDKCDRIFHFDSSKNEHLLWIQLSKNVFNNFVEYLAPVALFFAKYHKVLQLLLRMRGKHGKKWCCICSYINLFGLKGKVNLHYCALSRLNKV